MLDQPFVSSTLPTSGYTRDIIVINKPAFVQIVNKNLDLFHKRLGNKTNGEQLLNEIEEGRLVLSDVLQEDELLWGILLGFGRHNATLYARREEIVNNSLLLSEGFQTMDEELEYVQDHLTGFSHEYLIDLVPLPLFMSDSSHAETKELKRKYQKVQERICDIYRTPDFLDHVLKRLQ